MIKCYKMTIKVSNLIGNEQCFACETQFRQMRRLAIIKKIPSFDNNISLMSRSTLIWVPLAFPFADVSESHPTISMNDALFNTSRPHLVAYAHLSNNPDTSCSHNSSFEVTIFSKQPKKEFVCDDGSRVFECTMMNVDSC